MTDDKQPLPKSVDECDGDFQDAEENQLEGLRNEIKEQVFTKAHAALYQKNWYIPSNFRTWETVTNGIRSDAGSPFQFKVMSYNVLAQYLLECHSYLYANCLAYDLKWDVRATRLFKEITSYSPDILCLQEVQESFLNSFYSRFEDIGYCSVFKKRTGSRQDGCAIYFRASLFEMADHITVEFNQPDLSILNRDNVGFMVKLVPKDLRGSAVVVATTHLLFGPQNEDVRLAQMQLFLAEIDRFSYSAGQESGHLPIILTGDFNSAPDSSIIKLLDRGYVGEVPHRDESDWTCIGVTDNCQHLSVYLDQVQGCSTDFADVKIYHSELSAKRPDSPFGPQPMVTHVFRNMFNGDAIGHSLRLTSVYDKFTDSGNEASTYQNKWITTDYIYFSCCSTLKLVSRLRLPTAAECNVLGCLPNEQYASDHLAIAAIFELEPSKST